MYLDNLLFTDLAIKYNISNNIIYKNEMIRRLKFCNFDNKSINHIIKLELNIIKKRNIYLEKSLIDTFSWINYIPNYNNNIKFKIFNLPLEKYAQIDNHEVLPTTLTLGEIIILYTDAQILNECNNILSIPDNMQQEIKKYAIDKNNCASKLKLIFLGKFDLIHMMVNNCVSSREYYILCSRFFRNEAQIVFNNKWFNKLGLTTTNKIVYYLPYSIDYFNYYELS